LTPETVLAVTADTGEQVLPCRGELMLDQLLHVPLILKTPGRTGPVGERLNCICLSCDLWPFVLELLGVELPQLRAARSLRPVTGPDRSGRDYLLLPVPDGRYAIRTADWLFVGPGAERAAEVAERAELYLKPEDRWERNDVSREYPELVDVFARLLVEAIRACRQCGYGSLPAMPDELRTT